MTEREGMPLRGHDELDDVIELMTYAWDCAAYEGFSIPDYEEQPDGSLIISFKDRQYRLEIREITR